MCEILRAPGTQQNEYYVRDGAETVRKKLQEKISKMVQLKNHNKYFLLNNFKTLK